MGTSKSFPGQNNQTPLVPDWLDEEPLDFPREPDLNIPKTPDKPILFEPEPYRFTRPRTDFTRYAISDGSDRRSLAKAISHYVSESLGGPRNASKRMYVSRKSGKALLGFLSNTIALGPAEALKQLNLEALIGQPIEDVFSELTDLFFPDGGELDDGIARDAFIEAIAEMHLYGITDLDSMDEENVKVFFSLYVTQTIEIRLIADIGTKAIQVPSNPEMAIRVQKQLQEFVSGAVSDAVSDSGFDFKEIRSDTLGKLVDEVYERAYGLLNMLGEAEGAKP